MSHIILLLRQIKRMNVSWILIAIPILVIAVIIYAKLPKKRGAEDTGYPYQNAGTLFSPAERSFYGVLSQAVAENAKIFGKVRVADVAVPKKGLSRSDWQKAFNKISRKHFDFLLCSNDNLSVICAIELNDSSHKTEKRIKRDEFLSGVCNAAQIPLIQVPVKAGYVIDEIKQLLNPHLNLVELPIQEDRLGPQEPEKDEKVCPKCSSPMIARVAKRGSNAGKQFLGCSSYPKCKHIEPINA